MTLNIMLWHQRLKMTGYPPANEAADSDYSGPKQGSIVNHICFTLSNFEIYTIYTRVEYEKSQLICTC